MKRTSLFVGLCLLAGLAFNLAGPSPANGRLGVSIKLVSVIGQVDIHRPDVGWVTARPDDTVTVENRIRTGENARAELEYDDGTVLRMKSGCEIIILEGSIKLNFGNTWVQAVKRGTKFRVVTPTAVAGIKGTTFEVDVSRKTGDTRVAVYNGIVEVSAQDASILLFSARQTTIRSGRPPDKATYFDKWQAQKTWSPDLWKPEKQKDKPEKEGEKPSEKGELDDSSRKGALQWPPVGKIKPESPKPEGAPAEGAPPGSEKPDKPDDKRIKAREKLRDKEQFDRSPPPEMLRERFRDRLGKERLDKPDTPPEHHYESSNIEDLREDSTPPWEKGEYKRRVQDPGAKEGFEPGYKDRSSLEISDRKTVHQRKSPSVIPPRELRPSDTKKIEIELPGLRENNAQFLDVFSKLPREDQNRILLLMRDERNRQLDLLRQKINEHRSDLPRSMDLPPDSAGNLKSYTPANQLQNLNELYNLKRQDDKDWDGLRDRLPDIKQPGDNQSGTDSSGDLEDILRRRPPRDEVEQKLPPNRPKLPPVKTPQDIPDRP